MNWDRYNNYFHPPLFKFIVIDLCQILWLSFEIKVHKYMKIEEVTPEFEIKLNLKVCI